MTCPHCGGTGYEPGVFELRQLFVPVAYQHTAYAVIATGSKAAMRAAFDVSNAGPFDGTIYRAFDGTIYRVAAADCTACWDDDPESSADSEAAA